MEVLTSELWVFILSILPVSEIRGAMIYAFAQFEGVPVEIITAYVIAVIGNFLPVPFIMLAFRPIVKWLKGTRVFRKPAQWLEERTVKKAGKLSKASAGALMIFVAIPFPTTGAWTGAMIASLLDMRFKYALPAIMAGIMIAGIIMALLLTGVLNLGALGEFLITK